MTVFHEYSPQIRSHCWGFFVCFIHFRSGLYLFIYSFINLLINSFISSAKVADLKHRFIYYDYFFFLSFRRAHKLTFRIKGLYYVYSHCLKSRTRRKLSLEITFPCPYASKQRLTVPLRMRHCFTGRYPEEYFPS